MLDITIFYRCGSADGLSIQSKCCQKTRTSVQESLRAVCKAQRNGPLLGKESDAGRKAPPLSSLSDRMCSWVKLSRTFLLSYWVMC